MKRLLIYFFYDKDGIVDDYVPYFLEKFQPFCEEICTVVNGTITEKSRNKLEKYSNIVLERENTGFDVEAYRYGLNHYGFEKIRNNFDEVLLTNFTNYGPFFPLEEMFKNIEETDCDWWAPFKWYIKETDFRHMPSFFNVYKKNIIKSEEFEKYWKNLPKIQTYADSVLKHEQKQTKHWQNLGFKEGTWIDDFKYKDFWNEYWPLTKADRLVIEDKYAFIKRRSFYSEMINEEQFILVQNFLRYIEEKNLYDTKLIAKNLCRTLTFVEPKKDFKYWKYKLLYKIHPNKDKRKKYIQRLEKYLFTPKYKKLINNYNRE